MLYDGRGNPINSPNAKPATRYGMLREIGRGGTAFYNGFIKSDEFNSELSGTKGIETYDKMRRTDSQVQGLLFAISLPLLSAQWEIVKDEDDTKTKESHLDFARENIFRRINWQNTLRHALSCLWAGFSWFEKVLVIENNKYYIKKISPRLASTLYKWWTDDRDELVSVTQRLNYSNINRRSQGKIENEVEIPRNKIVLLSYQQEGNNYQGMSLLRGAYKHWFIKDQIYRIDAIRHERFAIGVPHIELPEEWDSEALSLANDIGRNWKGGEQSHLVTPNGWKINIVQMKGGAIDVMPTIQHHNEEIAKGGLAQFINFGQTQTGSRALGEMTTNFFYDSLIGLADWVSNIFNRELLWPLMDLNFRGEPRPKIRATDIGAMSLATVMNTLNSIGMNYITPDFELENHVRGLLNLPLKKEEDYINPLSKGELARGTVDQNTDNNPSQNPNQQSEQDEKLNAIMTELETIKRTMVDLSLSE